MVKNTNLSMLIVERKKTGSKNTYDVRDSYFGSLKGESSRSSIWINLLSWLKDVFLPRGYPYTVSPDYIQYQLWDSIQAFCSNLAGALSLHTTLIGLGVGEENASPIAAAVSWLTIDGVGRITSIYFAYVKGNELDNNSKQWRLFADVANDGAHFLKLISPYLPIPFGVTFCFSSIISSLVGVAGGATRASVMQHQALCNNMADVSAKDGSQETVVNLIGLLVSLTLLPFLTSNSLITWITFTLCVFLHLFSNYKAMRSLNMKTLNRGRILHILNDWTTRASIPNVYSTNIAEPLFFGPAFKSHYLTPKFNLKMGVSLQEILKSKSIDGCEIMNEEYFKNLDSRKYMLYFLEKSSTVYAIFHEKATERDFLKSFWAAYLLALNLEETSHQKLRSPFFIAKNSTLFKQQLCTLINDVAEREFPTFLQSLLDNDWLLEPLRLNIGEWRCECEFETKKEL